MAMGFSANQLPVRADSSLSFVTASNGSWKRGQCSSCHCSARLPGHTIMQQCRSPRIRQAKTFVGERPEKIADRPRAARIDPRGTDVSGRTRCVGVNHSETSLLPVDLFKHPERRLGDIQAPLSIFISPLGQVGISALQPHVSLGKGSGQRRPRSQPVTLLLAAQ